MGDRDSTPYMGDRDSTPHMGERGFHLQVGEIGDYIISENRAEQHAHSLSNCTSITDLYNGWSIKYSSQVNQPSLLQSCDYKLNDKIKK